MRIWFWFQSFTSCDAITWGSVKDHTIIHRKDWVLLLSSIIGFYTNMKLATTCWLLLYSKSRNHIRYTNEYLVKKWESDLCLWNVYKWWQRIIVAKHKPLARKCLFSNYSTIICSKFCSETFWKAACVCFIKMLDDFPRH